MYSKNLIKVQLEMLKDSFPTYSNNEHIFKMCKNLYEGIKDGNLEFDVFEQYCKNIIKWYTKNLESVSSDPLKADYDTHYNNINNLRKMLIDAQKNKVKFNNKYSESKQKSTHYNDINDLKKISINNQKSKVGISNKYIEGKEKSLSREIFLVHGHDNDLKSEVARFLEKLSLKPIILHEQANAGQTIIEKIEKYSDVGYGIVLYTPCDLGNSREKAEDNELNERARQNVVFEHGYLTAKLGRKNVAVICKGDLELPNDISGYVYLEDKNFEYGLVKELTSVGYNIDINQIL
ncbi:nucleotide-binding protein [Holzapfeliella sp. He02]|uniref:Nucleotide-binding protein n=1 Tax=Holzapfeliella saturejae TaxID=3082953 RepID=A0ABU8SHC8_9LACO